MNEQAPFLIIINFIPPYDAEIAALLAGPKGARVRFRYQTKYAPTITRISSLQKRFGTLLLRDRSTGWFMPLRQGLVISARQIGDVIHLEVELGATAALSGVSDIRLSQLKIFNQGVLSAIGSFSNEENTDLLNLILHESGDIQRLLEAWGDAADADDVTNWGNVVKTIDDHYPGLDLDFFRVIQLQDSNGQSIEFKRTEGLNYGYVVVPGNEYVIEVLQRTFTGRRGDSSVKYSRHMELLALHDDVQVQLPSRPVLGKYDLLRFSIYIRPTSRPGLRNLSLSMVRPSLDQRYGLELPLLLQRSMLAHSIRIAAISVFVISLVAYIVPNSFSISFHMDHRTVVPLSGSAIDKLAVILMLISSNIAGFGTWISSKAQLG